MKGLVRVFNARRRRMVGLMSGTSADGVDAALVEIETLPPNRGSELSWELVDFVHLPYGDAVRDEVLSIQESGPHVLERLTRLHFVLGNLFADAVEALARDAGVALDEIDAIASHGQTVCHFPSLTAELTRAGRELPGSEAWGKRGGNGWVSPATLQIGEPAVIAERTGVAVISNFRSRDVAAGGTGAPLVPLVDHLLFSDPVRSRLALNVGGIANFTALRAGGGRGDVVAFDTGPGNMVLDRLAEELSGGRKRMDEGGTLARRGTADPGIVDALLQAPYFALTPPRAAGRLEFGAEYAKDVLARCRAAGLSEASTLATATRLTAGAVHKAYVEFVEPRFAVEELIVSGGGAHNIALLESLAAMFRGVSVVTSDYYGLDVDAKEAAAFALLGHLSLNGRAGNLPSVTGAARPVVLGDLTPGGSPLGGG
jgi:anhydro-N-acetylmuramic acid kinase